MVALNAGDYRVRHNHSDDGSRALPAAHRLRTANWTCDGRSFWCCLDFFSRSFVLHTHQSTETVFRSIFIFSAITSAVLNNDAAVLLLTPLIVGLIRRC
jgi:hypothetical protein